MDLSSMASADISASPPPCGRHVAAETAAWAISYGAENMGKRPSDWSLEPSISAALGGGSPTSGDHRHPLYTDMLGGGGRSQAADMPKPATGRRILCRSQSEAGASVRTATDSPPAADANSACYQQPKVPTPTGGFSSAADLRLSAVTPLQPTSGPSYELATGGMVKERVGHLYHARSDIQHREATAAAAAVVPTPPPPLLHSASLGDMNGGNRGNAVKADYLSGGAPHSIAAAGRHASHSVHLRSSPSDLNGAIQTARSYVPPPAWPVDGRLPGHQDFGDAEAVKGGRRGGGGGPPQDTCAHCGAAHAAGPCPLPNRGFAEKVSGGNSLFGLYC
jgi:hypothetical protein